MKSYQRPDNYVVILVQANIRQNLYLSKYCFNFKLVWRMIYIFRVLFEITQFWIYISDEGFCWKSELLHISLMASNFCIVDLVILTEPCW